MTKLSALRSLLILALASLTLLTSTAPAQAWTRADGADRPVLLVHGFSLEGGTDCANYWAGFRSQLAARGWTGEVATIGYYSKDTTCTANVMPAGTKETSLELIAQKFAWYIHDTYTARGQAVDVAAHSMGGLIVRQALQGVRHQLAGYPTTLYVEDVVTMATPHQGATAATFCLNWNFTKPLQCRQMTAGSAFLTTLRDRDAVAAPQGTGGTDWTVVGATDDAVVSASSATGMASAQHRMIFSGPRAIGHSDLIRWNDYTDWDYSYSNGGSAWTYEWNGYAPNRRAYLALFHGTDW